MKRLIFWTVLIAVLSYASYAWSAGPYGVKHDFFCTLEIATRMAHLANDGDLNGAQAVSVDATKAGDCSKAPKVQAFVITEVWYGPFLYEGIGRGYVVCVSDDICTWAWPGINSNLPKDGGRTPI
jgi:hypothetical protein